MHIERGIKSDGAKRKPPKKERASSSPSAPRNPPRRPRDRCLKLRQASLCSCARGLTGFVREYRFHPERRWRLDYAQPQLRIGAEIHGGGWSRARHVRGSGFVRDLEKLNAHVLPGWRVAAGDTAMALDGRLADLIEQLVKGARLIHSAAGIACNSVDRPPSG
jgi:hypothetical protein